MEYLSRRLGVLRENKRFGYHPKYKRVGITHLLFADDLLVFYKANMDSIGAIKEAITEFSFVSELMEYDDKSEVFLAGLGEEGRAGIRSMLNMKEGVLRFKYLEISLGSRKFHTLSVSHWWILW